MSCINCNGPLTDGHKAHDGWSGCVTSLAERVAALEVAGKSSLEYQDGLHRRLGALEAWQAGMSRPDLAHLVGALENAPNPPNEARTCATDCVDSPGHDGACTPRRYCVPAPAAPKAEPARCGGEAECEVCNGFGRIAPGVECVDCSGRGWVMTATAPSWSYRPSPADIKRAELRESGKLPAPESTPDVPGPVCDGTKGGGDGDCGVAGCSHCERAALNATIEQLRAEVARLKAFAESEYTRGYDLGKNSQTHAVAVNVETMLAWASRPGVRNVAIATELAMELARLRAAGSASPTYNDGLDAAAAMLWAALEGRAYSTAHESLRSLLDRVRPGSGSAGGSGQGESVTDLGSDTPWPLSLCLTKGADELDHLINCHDCDHHGWELVNDIATFMRLYAERIKEAAAVPAETKGGE